MLNRDTPLWIGLMLDIGRSVGDDRKHLADAPAVLFVGHATSATGFARVIHSILQSLPGGYDLHHFGINQPDDRSDLGWTLHGNSDPENFHSPDRFREVVELVRPRIVVFVDEPWAFSEYALAIPEDRDYRVVFYGAIDSDFVIPLKCVPDLARLDCFVAFTDFGRETLRGRFRETHADTVPRIEIIPHGVDSDLFFPIAGDADGVGFAESRRNARQMLFRGENDLGDAFIVLNANQNQPHKRIDLTLEGFALFAHGKPDSVKLCLHMGTPPRKADTVPLVDRLGIRDRVLSTTTGPQHPSVSSEKLNLIYNACDVGINTSEGEGWGLISFEHAATGAAQIVPRHTACEELWRETALLVDPDPHSITVNYGIASGRSVKADGVAEALETLYTQPDERRRLARAAFRHATLAEYDWRNIAQQWHSLFQKLLRT